MKAVGIAPARPGVVAVAIVTSAGDCRTFNRRPEDLPRLLAKQAPDLVAVAAPLDAELFEAIAGAAVVVQARPVEPTDLSRLLAAAEPWTEPVGTPGWQAVHAAEGALTRTRIALRLGASIEELGGDPLLLLIAELVERSGPLEDDLAAEVAAVLSLPENPPPRAARPGDPMDPDKTPDPDALMWLDDEGDDAEGLAPDDQPPKRDPKPSKAAKPSKGERAR